MNGKEIYILITNQLLLTLDVFGKTSISRVKKSSPLTNLLQIDSFINNRFFDEYLFIPLVAFEKKEGCQSELQSLFGSKVEK